MKKALLLESIFGLLAVVITVITIYPLILGGGIGVVIMVFGLFISALTLLAAGIFRLPSAISFERLSLAKKINIATSIIVMITAIAILYFQIVASGTGLLHLLFGFGLLSYAVGRVVFGALTREHNLGSRAFNSAMGLSIGILSIIIIFFPLFPISSGHTQVFLTYGVFMRVGLILVGIDFLVSAAFGMFWNKQKQIP